MKKVKNKKIHVIFSHINTDKFSPKNKLELKKKYGYNQRIVFYYGAMWEVKGIDYLIDAIPKIIECNKEVLFIFAPRNKDLRIKRYQKRIKDIGIKENCRFILEDVKIEDYVNMADLIALPYPSLIGTEGNPSCLLEAMACKTPVVTTDLPEIRETTNSYVMFAEPKSVQSLTKSILIALREYPGGLIEKAYKRSQEFNIDKVTNQFIRLYQELIPIDK
ncbi:MAG: glycosyltransferase family 4 protein [Nanoarchaeota archaeon]|nr:glycosyltransferase family 4 protein [Nanoarchaeota archaeon]